MPLSPPVSRQLRHRRAIRVDAYEREDGLWDIEACLTDEKPRDVVLASGVRPNGLPIHELWLRITIDRKLNVVDAEASSDWVPYPGLCEASNPAYRALIGLNLFRNFRRDAARLLAGTAGCTHLTELCAVLHGCHPGFRWRRVEHREGKARRRATGRFAKRIGRRFEPARTGQQRTGRTKQRFERARKRSGKRAIKRQTAIPVGPLPCAAIRRRGGARVLSALVWPRAAFSGSRGRRARRTDREDGPSRVSGPGGSEVQSNSQTEGNHA